MKVPLEHFIIRHNDVVIGQNRRINKTLLSNSFIDLHIRKIPQIDNNRYNNPGDGLQAASLRCACEVRITE